MKKNTASTVGLVFSFFILWLLIFNTVFCLAKHYLIPWHLYIFPLAAFVISLLSALIRKIPSWIKYAAPAVLAVCAFVFCGFFSFMGHTEYRVYEGTEGIEKYNKRNETMNAYSSSVDIDEFGEYTDIELHYYDCLSIFSDRSRIVIVRYSDEEFEKMKSKLQIEKPDYTADVDGFDFAVSVTEAFPKSIRFSGFNEETKEIATVYYCNMDLDDISSFESFIRNWCGWTLIK